MSEVMPWTLARSAHTVVRSRALACFCTGAAPAVKTDVAKRARTKEAEERNILECGEKSRKEGKKSV
ncbi:hypothetical protein K438DRAFT_1848210 [Mycena galopus ATCC 62051]|nr:hypothetical protein K438DRAFT_1848210 [Mycena galopus ATCC 62051]